MISKQLPEANYRVYKKASNTSKTDLQHLRSGYKTDRWFIYKTRLGLGPLNQLFFLLKLYFNNPNFDLPDNNNLNLDGNHTQRLRGMVFKLHERGSPLDVSLVTSNSKGDDTLLGWLIS